MNRMTYLVLGVVSVLATACTASPPVARDAALTSSAVDSRTIHVEIPADADVADIPWLMAIDALRDQGYTIETVSMSSSLSPAALAQGDLDIVDLSNQHAWSAIGQGAAILTFMDKSANTFMIISSEEIQMCADLDGKAVAISGVSTVSGALFNAYLEDNCPDAVPEILVVKGGSNRTAALLSGELDAAVQDLDDLIKIEAERPGEFHSLVTFAGVSPAVQIHSLVTSRDFAEQHPEVMKDFIRAVFSARHSLQDAQALRQAIVQYMELEPDRAQKMADAYLEQEIFDAEGTFTLETVQATLEFLQAYGDLPPELTVQDVADLSYYDEVVDEIRPQ